MFFPSRVAGSQEIVVILNHFSVTLTMPSRNLFCFGSGLNRAYLTGLTKLSKCCL